MISVIQPLRVKSRLIRLGNPHDGGYVIEIGSLQRVDALYSYGVGGNVSFELDFFHMSKKPVFIFDHTVDDPLVPNLTFKKEGLGSMPKKGFNNFLSCNTHKNVLLKMDVEGAEVEWIQEMDFETLPVDTLIVEFHNLPKDLTLIEKIKKYYDIVWIHGNNFSQMMMGVLPRLLEVTFVRNNLDIYDGLATKKYPLEIDSRNVTFKPDVKIDLRPFLF